MKLLRSSDGSVKRCHFTNKTVRLAAYSKQEKIILILSHCQNDLRTIDDLARLVGCSSKPTEFRNLLRELRFKRYLDRFRTEIDRPYYHLTLPAGVEYLKQISGEDKVDKLPGFVIRKPGRCSCGKYRKIENPLCKRCWSKLSEYDQQRFQSRAAQAQDIKNEIISEFKTKFVRRDQKVDQSNP